MNFRFWPGGVFWGILGIAGVFLSGFFFADFQVEKHHPWLLPFLKKGEGGPFFLFSVLLSIFSLFFLCKKLWRVLSAGRFLKFAFLSFDKTGLFPPEAGGGKNPLLSFYGNRVNFLNRRMRQARDKTGQEIGQSEESGGGRRRNQPHTSLNFLQILQEELDKLKLKTPNLAVREIYKFDARVFGFEKFCRIIIKELLSNGIEAMGGLKKPCLDLYVQKDIQKKGEVLLFSVRDYGKGLSQKSKEKITTLYYSTKSQTGTGLNLVQSILKANGGEINFESLTPLGLKVQVRLPLKCFLQNA